MIRKLSRYDFKDILNVVNDAAAVYEGAIPKDCWRKPYMSAEELKSEIQRGVQFCGIFENGTCVAVMGIQPVKDVTLIRHAYTLRGYQRKGLGKTLLGHLLSLALTNEVYVGTWREASWAIDFYRKNGFKLVSDTEKDKLLKQYWNIPKRQIETSVVLQLERHQ